MSFSGDIKTFTNATKAKLDEALAQVEKNAKARLVEILGDDVSLIKSIRLDADVGKFYEVDAPDSVVEKLRQAGLLKP